MATLDPVELLRLWDAACVMAPVERAFTVGTAASPAMSAAEVAALPLGRAHARLLEVRTALLGPEMAATAACPSCGEDAEFELFTTDLLLLADKIVDDPEPVIHDGETVRWRLPTGADLVATPDAANLLRRCAGGTELAPALREAVVAGMAAADPLAEVMVDLSCPACHTAFAADVDVSAFVWAELDGRARRLLLEVDALARAYGWSETEVLALSEPRRAAYLRTLAEGTP